VEIERAAPITQLLTDEGGNISSLIMEKDGRRFIRKEIAELMETRAPLAILARRGGVTLVEGNRRGHFRATGDIVRRRKSDCSMRKSARRGARDDLRGTCGSSILRALRPTTDCVRTAPDGADETLGPLRVRLAVVIREADDRALGGTHSGISRSSRARRRLAQQPSRGSRRNGGGHSVTVDRAIVYDDDLCVLGKRLRSQCGETTTQGVGTVARRHDDRHDGPATSAAPGARNELFRRRSRPARHPLH
jgi:hypothetical protein